MLGDEPVALAGRSVTRLAEGGEHRRAAFDRRAIAGLERVHHQRRLLAGRKRRQSSGNGAGRRRPERHPIGKIRDSPRTRCTWRVRAMFGKILDAEAPPSGSRA